MDEVNYTVFSVLLGSGERIQTQVEFSHSRPKCQLSTESPDSRGKEQKTGYTVIILLCILNSKPFSVVNFQFIVTVSMLYKL